MMKTNRLHSYELKEDENIGYVENYEIGMTLIDSINIENRRADELH